MAAHVEKFAQPLAAGREIKREEKGAWFGMTYFWLWMVKVWRPGIEVRVMTQRLGVFKPITWYADSRIILDNHGLFAQILNFEFTVLCLGLLCASWIPNFIVRKCIWPTVPRRARRAGGAPGTLCLLWRWRRGGKEMQRICWSTDSTNIPWLLCPSSTSYLFETKIWRV